MKGRYILDNVFFTIEVIEWAKESDQYLVMLLFNFVKTYTKVN